MDKKQAKWLILGLAGAGLAGLSLWAFLRSRMPLKKSEIFEKNIAELRRRIMEVVDGSAAIEYFTKVDAVTVKDPEVPGLSMQVLCADKLAKKDAARFSKEDPFLPPFEDGLFICDLEHHRIIANKFAVIKYHTLITTKLFEDQHAPLAAKDFTAAYPVLRALKGFCFYNGGEVSGSSQPHRHVQAVPHSKDFPQAVLAQIDAEISAVATNPETGFKSHHLSFFRKYCHLIVDLPAYDPDTAASDRFEDFAKVFHDRYLYLLEALHNGDLRHSYNLVWTDRWMFMMLRSKEHVADKYSTNCMGMLGSLFTRSRADMLELAKKTPSQVFDEICMMI